MNYNSKSNKLLIEIFLSSNNKLINQIVKKQFLFLLLILIMCNQVYSIQRDLLNKPIRVESPDGHLIFSLWITNSYPSYSVSYKDKTIIKNSRLSLEFKESGEFGRDLTISEPL